MKSSDWMAGRRRRARAAGLCITCCTAAPSDGRSTCLKCSAEAGARVRRVRAKQRAIDEARRLAADMERAGDAARLHHLHDDAARYYADALDASALQTEDGARVAEKLAGVIALGHGPNDAAKLLDRVAAFYSDKPDAAAKSVDNLLQKSRLLHFESKHEAARALVRQAIRIAEGSAGRAVSQRAYVTMIGYMFVLGRDDEAEAYMHAIEPLEDDDDPSIRIAYFRTRAQLGANRGDAEEMIEYFDRAIAATQDSDDILRVVSIWSSYSLCAMKLGNIELATACCQRSLLLVRRFRVGWLTPVLCLDYADMLFQQGRADEALEYVLDAMRYDVRSTTLDQAFATDGIPIALYKKNEEVLQRCARPAVFEAAVEDADLATLGSLASAFAAWHDACGRPRQARDVLHRTTKRLAALGDPATRRMYSPFVWDFPIAVARFGAPSDVPIARAIIQSHADLPNAAIAQACLRLFDAFAISQSDPRGSERLAAEASRAFTELKWIAHAGLARTLLRREDGILPEEPHAAALLAGIFLTLTPRERQVAELALRGLTNRKIATGLAISEHTVESHMTSILGRLGLRSRHQLGDVAAQ